MLSLLVFMVSYNIGLQPVFALHFLEHPHFGSFSSIKRRVN